jgi:hypothetical protein
LTLSRKTTVTFGFGLGTSNYGGATRLHIVGNSNLRHQMSRSWSLRVGYGRGLNFFDGFAAPLFSDSANLGVGGSLSARLRFDASMAYSVGGADTASARQQFQSYRSVAGLRGRLTRHFDAFLQYFFYHHEFDDSSFLVQGAPPNLSRQGLRAGLSLSMPLRSARTP